MGMAASQARFLGLTARKNNVEFEGQQINQQRTALSNQSANYYNDLLGMSVPVPPSVDDYTKTVYSFTDGALENQITAMIAKGNGNYTVSYLRNWTDDFSVVQASTSIVTGSQAGPWKIGAQDLRTLGSAPSYTFTIGKTIKKYGQTFDVKEDGGRYYIDKPALVLGDQCTPAEINDFKYVRYVGNTIEEYTKDPATGAFLDENGADSGLAEDDLLIVIFDENETDPQKATTFVSKEADGSYYKMVDGTEQEYLTQAEIDSIKIYTADDEYIKTLSSDQLNRLLDEEQEYLLLLREKYGDGDYMVRYIKNSSTGEYNPYFYKKSDLEQANYDKNGNSLSSINCYKIGSETRSEEVKAIDGCQIERDSSGRFINITIPTGNGDSVTYALTTSTVTDQDKYQDAMNQYEFEKYQYDQTIQEINSKIEIVQAEDKNLELRLKQLDTEHSAIQTEVEAVSQVIKKNTESTFKTFG